MDNISQWLKTYFAKHGGLKFVVGVLGGIDSALISTLCAETGIETFVVSMPIHQKETQLHRAHMTWLAEKYESRHKIEPIPVFRRQVIKRSAHGKDEES